MNMDEVLDKYYKDNLEKITKMDEFLDKYYQDNLEKITKMFDNKSFESVVYEFGHLYYEKMLSDILYVNERKVIMKSYGVEDYDRLLDGQKATLHNNVAQDFTRYVLFEMGVENAMQWQSGCRAMNGCYERIMEEGVARVSEDVQNVFSKWGGVGSARSAVTQECWKFLRGYEKEQNTFLDDIDQNKFRQKLIKKRDEFIKDVMERTGLNEQQANTATGLFMLHSIGMNDPFLAMERMRPIIKAYEKADKDRNVYIEKAWEYGRDKKESAINFLKKSEDILIFMAFVTGVSVAAWGATALYHTVDLAFDKPVIEKNHRAIERMVEDNSIAEAGCVREHFSQVPPMNGKNYKAPSLPRVKNYMEDAVSEAMMKENKRILGVVSAEFYTTQPCEIELITVPNNGLSREELFEQNKMMINRAVEDNIYISEKVATLVSRSGENTRQTDYNSIETMAEKSIVQYAKDCAERNYASGEKMTVDMVKNITFDVMKKHGIDTNDRGTFKKLAVAFSTAYADKSIDISKASHKVEKQKAMQQKVEEQNVRQLG